MNECTGAHSLICLSTKLESKYKYIVRVVKAEVMRDNFGDQVGSVILHLINS